MNILMRIRRYNPEKDNKPYWDEFRVDADPIFQGERTSG